VPDLQALSRYQVLNISHSQMEKRLLHIVPHKVYKAPKEELKMLENHDRFKRLTQYLRLYS
jgi:hypothetical protein